MFRCFLFRPDVANKNYRSILKSEGNQDVFKNSSSVEYYYISSLALYRIDKALRSGIIEKKFLPARFHMLTAIAALFFKKRNPPAKMLETLKVVLQNPHKSRILVRLIASRIWELSNSTLDRDLSRKKPFTDKVVSALKAESSQAIVGQLGVGDEWVGTLFES